MPAPTEPPRPYFDKTVLEQRRRERAAQLRQALKQALGFGKCKIVRNDEQGYKRNDT